MTADERLERLERLVEEIHRVICPKADPAGNLQKRAMEAFARRDRGEYKRLCAQIKRGREREKVGNGS